jgi:pilus assembly protein CpaF
VVETTDVFTSREGRLVRADGYPPHPERFATLGIDLAALLGDRP